MRDAVMCFAGLAAILLLVGALLWLAAPSKECMCTKCCGARDGHKCDCFARP